jgi:hypothetical protein
MRWGMQAAYMGENINAYTYFRDIWREDTIWSGYGVVQTRCKNIRLTRIALDKRQRRVFVNAEINVREIS